MFNQFNQLLVSYLDDYRVQVFLSHFSLFIMRFLPSQAALGAALNCFYYISQLDHVFVMNRHSFCVLPWELVISFEIVCVLSSICLHNLIITKADYNSLIAVNLPQLALLWLKLCYLVCGMLELILYVSLGDRMLNQILLFL